MAPWEASVSTSLYHGVRTCLLTGATRKVRAAGTKRHRTARPKAEWKRHGLKRCSPRVGVRSSSVFRSADWVLTYVQVPQRQTRSSL